MYEKVEFVRNKGEFAVRGDIMDIFSPNEKRPIKFVLILKKLNLYIFLMLKSKNL